MNVFNKYIVPLAFLILAAVNLNAQRWVESALYISVGAGFVIMNLLRTGAISSNKKFWNALSWILIIAAAVLFFLVLRIAAYGL